MEQLATACARWILATPMAVSRSPNVKISNLFVNSRAAGTIHRKCVTEDASGSLREAILRKVCFRNISNINGVATCFRFPADFFAKIIDDDEMKTRACSRHTGFRCEIRIDALENFDE